MSNPNPPVTAAEVVSDLFQTFREQGHRSYGENVTELQHALQCATLAQLAGQSPEIVAACLLHDYGHLVHDLGEDIAERGVDARHEHVGANRLARWFGPEVVEPVRLHAASKRYLCWKEAGYLAGLSEASVRSLGLQGGVMTDEEAREFEQHPQYAPAVAVRRYDDLGKDPNRATPDLEAFRPLLESLVRREA
ncbi:MAG: HD domain-containing protein [Verrucomicrobia bacterium]|nr:HD domain-containing protein [Verrucomicrobiota bacterium]